MLFRGVLDAFWASLRPRKPGVAGALLLVPLLQPSRHPFVFFLGCLFKPVLVGEREARLFFLSFLRFRVVSGDSGRALAPLALVFCSFLPLQNSMHIYDFPLFLVCSESFWMAKIFSNSMPKTLQISWTNPPQTHQNRCQNLPNSSPRRSKIEV